MGNGRRSPAVQTLFPPLQLGRAGDGRVFHVELHGTEGVT
jgi:hypothetical protein